MIRAVLVDDEPAGRRRLHRLLRDHPDVEVIAEAADGRSARAEVLTRRPDVLFLDVQMPEETGPAALRLLRETMPESALPFVIFTTAYAEHALDAFALEAIDYLLKPVERAGLARALKRVRTRIAGRAQPATPAAPAPPTAGPTASAPAVAQRLIAHRGTRTIPLELDDIAALVVEDETVRAWTLDGRFRLEGTLREVAARLPDDFVQVSRAALVRLDRIASLKPTSSGTFEASLHGIEGTLHVSRRRGRELRKALGR